VSGFREGWPSGFRENLTAASDNNSGLNVGTSFGGRLNGARRNERDLGEKDELSGFRATNYRKLKKMVFFASKRNIFTLFFLKSPNFFENSLLSDVAVERG